MKNPICNISFVVFDIPITEMKKAELYIGMAINNICLEMDVDPAKDVQLIMMSNELYVKHFIGVKELMDIPVGAGLKTEHEMCFAIKFKSK